MALSLPDHWLWDHWIADDGERYHLFFLRASRALHNPQRRHWRASLGHAVSEDARTWELLPDALVPVVVVTQTLVELLVMVVYARLLPRLIRDP